MSQPSGKLIARDTVRLERSLPGPIERVWAYLVEPEKRALWLAGGPMEQRVGGKVELHFNHANLSHEKAYPARFKAMENGHRMTGVVKACEPPRLLTYTWQESADRASEVTFELTPQGQRVLLVITHRLLPDRKTIVGVSGGWDAHVGVLEDRLDGREPRGFWSAFAELEAEYEKRTPKE